MQRVMLIDIVLNRSRLDLDPGNSDFNTSVNYLRKMLI